MTMYTSVMYVYLLIFMLMQCCVTNMLLCCGNKLTYLLTYSTHIICMGGSITASIHMVKNTTLCIHVVKKYDIM